MCYSLGAFKGYIPPRNPSICQVSLFQVSLISLSASKPALCPPFQVDGLRALSPRPRGHTPIPPPGTTGSKLGVGNGNLGIVHHLLCIPNTPAAPAQSTSLSHPTATWNPAQTLTNPFLRASFSSSPREQALLQRLT